MKKYLFPWIFIIAVAIGWYIAWPYLPEQIPRHYNISGEVDGYFSKVEAASVSIGSMILFYIIWIFMGRIDLTKGNHKQHAKALSMTNHAILFVVFGCNIFAVLASSGYIVSGSIAFNFGLGTIFLVVGNYMQQTKPNGFVGIRMYWTLENPEVWRKTHRFASKVFVIGAMFMYVAAVFPDPINMFSAVGTILLCVIISTIKSYSIYKEEIRI
ncbi:SdpI family protein [Bacillus sp. DX4.1]|uniref:SdpI family protein n=1 Tax=Bacillus sp. DX4.1 TaxID=3055867 RepID=UPI0025A28AEA|nr:SdpI family protein [Bacillus sp. DX4.1]MDM5190500.1 SdpI family protein [Bacillus sp. DX4.1]